MRPAHMYANLTSHEYQQLIDMLHGPWRSAARAVMVLLSAKGLMALFENPQSYWIAAHPWSCATAACCGRW